MEALGLGAVDVSSQKQLTMGPNHDCKPVVMTASLWSTIHRQAQTHCRKQAGPLARHIQNMFYSTCAAAAAARSSAADMTLPAALGSSLPASSKAKPSSASRRRYFWPLAQAAPQLPLKPPSAREAAITRWQGTAGAKGLRLRACGRGGRDGPNGVNCRQTAAGEANTAGRDQRWQG